jgi:hypothetical protein
MSGSWYNPLASVTSLGSRYEGARSHAGLHQARREHLGQFFTTDAIATFVWRIAEPAIDTAVRRARSSHSGDRVALFDNSIGSARLFQFAEPSKHTLAGVDVHQESVDAVIAAAGVAGFHTDFLAAGMEEIRPAGFGVALINPPFSIHLESPQLEPYDCCSFGKFGRRTSCMSHVYAVAQALGAADIVVAVLPATFAASLESDSFFSHRLRYVGYLPASAFASEGATVDTAVAVWDSKHMETPVVVETINDLAAATTPKLGLFCRPERLSRPRQLQRHGIEASAPSIKSPVTGDRSVWVVRHNRKIILKFACGLTEAKVRNAVLFARVEAVEQFHRFPDGVEFVGQGLLDLEAHLMQSDPIGSFQVLLARVELAGGQPVVDQGIFGYLRRRARRLSRHQVPFAHSILATGVSRTASTWVQLQCKKSFLLEPAKWGSPIVKTGQRCNAKRDGAGRWLVTFDEQYWPMTDEEINQRFETTAACSKGVAPQWIQKFPGRLAAFPELAHEASRRIASLGIGHWLSRPYQLSDLTEVAISPFGACVAWDMGLGKSRLAFALCLIAGGSHNLIVTEAHLVPELASEFEAIGFPSSDWQVIDSVATARQLRRINVISYSRLRSNIGGNAAGSRATYAKALRRRISTMICDEGHCLRNLESDQTRAAWNVAARRRYVFTGTLVANYPRDTLPILAWVGGSAKAHQPWGLRGESFMEPRMVESMSYVRRGVDAFRESFVTLEWVTNEFAEDLQSGAKREVPKIANLPAYREMLAPWVKRRVGQEPDVARDVCMPSAARNVATVKWSNGHLGFYLKVADEFAAWYKQARTKAGEKRVNVNLISLLARIGAVETACNIPQAGVDGFGAFSGRSSKQVKAVERITELVAAGHKIIVYAKRPALLELLAAEVGKKGIESVIVHGGRSIEERTAELRGRFRHGSVPVLFASLGCVRTGLNIPEADRVLFASRDWSATTEKQALARVLRPQQKGAVVAEYIHLPGSIDDYQGQMVEFKQDAADSGMDWATPQKEEEEFVHLDTILGRFVDDLAKLRGLKGHELRDYLSKHAA